MMTGWSDQLVGLSFATGKSALYWLTSKIANPLYSPPHLAPCIHASMRHSFLAPPIPTVLDAEGDRINGEQVRAAGYVRRSVRT